MKGEAFTERVRSFSDIQAVAVFDAVERLPRGQGCRPTPARRHSRSLSKKAGGERRPAILPVLYSHEDRGVSWNMMMKATHPLPTRP